MDRVLAITSRLLSAISDVRTRSQAPGKIVCPAREKPRIPPAALVA